MRLLGLLVTLTAMLNGGLSAFADVTFKFAANSIDEGPLKTRMEANISDLLTEINRAGTDGDTLNLSGIGMTKTAKERLIALWHDSPFVCDKQTNISKCLRDFMGYQVELIPITMKPQNPSYDKAINQELTISLSQNGKITGVRPSLERNEYVNRLLTPVGMEGVIETRMRREILKWIEDLKSYYAERNIDALSKIFGKSVHYPIFANRTDSIETTDSIGRMGLHKSQASEDLLNRLRGLFAAKKMIDVDFEHLFVIKHGAKPNVYGVQIQQSIHSEGFDDEGWMFSLWDFNDPEKPLIHIITWQSEEEVERDGLNTVDDFYIP